MAALEAAAGMATEWPEARQETVLPKCDDKSAPGQWVCLTHREPMPNNLAMMTHTDQDGEHVVGWRCSAHGIEQP